MVRAAPDQHMRHDVVHVVHQQLVNLTLWRVEHGSHRASVTHSRALASELQTTMHVFYSKALLETSSPSTTKRPGIAHHNRLRLSRNQLFFLPVLPLSMRFAIKLSVSSLVPRTISGSVYLSVSSIMDCGESYSRSSPVFRK